MPIRLNGRPIRRQRELRELLAEHPLPTGDVDNGRVERELEQGGAAPALG